MPRLYKQKGSRKWYSDFNDPTHPKAGKDGRVRVPLHADKKIAQIKLGELMSRKEALDPDKPAGSLAWFEAKARFESNFLRHKKPPTIYAHNQAMAALEAFKPIRLPADITPNLLQEAYYHWKQIGRTHYIRNKYVISLCAMMRRFEKWGIVRGQDWDLIEVDPLPRGRLHFWEIEEVAHLIKNMDDIYRTMVYLGARAGLRRGEMRWTHRDDVDFTRNLLYVVSKPKMGWTVKNYQVRSIRMTPDLRTYLMELLADGREWAIQREDGHRPTLNRMTVDFSLKVRKIWLNGARMKGSLHTLRHTLGAHLTIAGRMPQEVRDILGHKSISATEIYSHLRPNAQREAIDSLPNLGIIMPVNRRSGVVVSG